MANPYKVKFYHDEDYYGHEYCHEIENVTEIPNVGIYFKAYDMCECPEDATLNRDLFDGYDYLAAIELGMELAQLGYDRIEVEHIDNNEEDED